MKMFGHEHVRMDRQAVALGRIKQAFPEKLVVVIVPKDWIAVMSRKMMCSGTPLTK
jgi:hypothetical protein